MALPEFVPKWEKQILHIWVQNEDAANKVYRAATKLLEKDEYKTLLVISMAEKSDIIFTNDIAMLTQSPEQEIRWRGELKSKTKRTKTENPRRRHTTAIWRTSKNLTRKKRCCLPVSHQWA